MLKSVPKERRIMKSKIEFCLPDNWPEDKKQDFTNSLEKKVAEKLEPLANKILEDNKKDKKEGK